MSIPDGGYYLVHPALNQELKNRYNYDFYDMHNIIGNSLDFYPSDTPKSSLHVHFGFDRDSLILVIPELQRNKCIALVAEPSSLSAYSAPNVSVFSKIIFRYDNNEPFSFTLYHDGLREDQKSHILNNIFLKMKKSVLFYTQSNDTIKQLIESCETISFCTLPTKVFNNMHPFPPLGKKIIYYCQRYLIPENINRVNNVIHRNAQSKNDCIPALIDRYELKPKVEFKKEYDLIIEFSIEKGGVFICPDRSNSALKPSPIVTRTKSDGEFRFYALRQKLLAEGIYQFYKTLKQSTVTKDDFHKNKVLCEYFIHLQIGRLLKDIQNLDVVEERIFENNSQEQFVLHLEEFGKKTISRIESNLAKRYITTGKTIDIDFLRRESIFPNVIEWEKFVEERFNKSTYNDLEKISQVLCLCKNNIYKKTFISYSTADAGIAKLINKILNTYGITTYLFQIHRNYNIVKKAMKDLIEDFDLVLFIASIDSLKSNNCHYELAQCREKHRRTWEDLLIPIRIDNYIFEVSEEILPTEIQNDYWKNILFIKERDVVDFSDINIENENGIEPLHSKMKNLINKRMIKNDIKKQGPV